MSNNAKKILTFISIALMLSRLAFAQSEDATASETIVPFAERTVPVEKYTYWRGALAEGRKPYETEVVQLAFELSKEKYGPAELVVSDRSMSPIRGREKLKEGHEVHVHTAPILYQDFDTDISFILSRNILNNLLGYRQPIIRSRDAEVFQSIRSFKQLKHLVVGQGRYWPDTRVYRHNRVAVVEADRYESLFPMLDRERFDLLPLGITEAEEALSTGRSQDYKLITVPNLVIYYPWPVYIMVSKTKPKLRDRLQYGIIEADKKGLIDDLFKRHFSRVIERFNRSDTRIIVLENPMLEENNVWRQPDLLPRAQHLD